MHRYLCRLLLVAATLAPVPSLADTVYVVRPQIGSGSAKVLPQDAFASTGTPTTGSPGTNAPDDGGFVFFSEHYGEKNGFPLKAKSAFRPQFNAFDGTGVTSPVATSLQFCITEDDKRPGHAASALDFVDIQTPPGGKVVLLTPLKAGKMAIRLNCIGQPASLVIDVELTVTN
jgi:hypothetical protein